MLHSYMFIVQINIHMAHNNHRMIRTRRYLYVTTLYFHVYRLAPACYPGMVVDRRSVDGGPKTDRARSLLLLSRNSGFHEPSRDSFRPQITTLVKLPSSPRHCIQTIQHSLSSAHSRINFYRQPYQPGIFPQPLSQLTLDIFQ
jgi:hypothetical protein